MEHPNIQKKTASNESQGFPKSIVFLLSVFFLALVFIIISIVFKGF